MQDKVSPFSGDQHPIYQLPIEVWLQISTELSFSDIGKLSILNKKLYEKIRSDRFWQEKLKIYYPKVPENNNKERYELFIEHFKKPFYIDTRVIQFKQITEHNYYRRLYFLVQERKFDEVIDWIEKELVSSSSEKVKLRKWICLLAYLRDYQMDRVLSQEALDRYYQKQLEKDLTADVKLIMQIFCNQIAEVKKCITKANVNSFLYGHTPLFLATGAGHIGIVKYLIEQGADMNQASYGETPLHHACWIRNFEIMKLLVKQGANINAETPDYNNGDYQYRPLDGLFTCRPNDSTLRLEMMEYLVNHGGKAGYVYMLETEYTWFRLKKHSNKELKFQGILKEHSAVTPSPLEAAKILLNWYVNQKFHYFHNRDIVRTLLGELKNCTEKDFTTETFEKMIMKAFQQHSQTKMKSFLGKKVNNYESLNKNGHFKAIENYIKKRLHKNETTSYKAPNSNN